MYSGLSMQGKCLVVVQVPESFLHAEEVASRSSIMARAHYCSNLVDRAVAEVNVQSTAKHFRRKYKRSRVTQQKMFKLKYRALEKVLILQQTIADLESSSCCRPQEAM